MASSGDASWQPNDEAAAAVEVAPSQPQAGQQLAVGAGSQQDQAAAAWPPGPGPLAGVLASLPAVAAQPRDMQPAQPQAAQLPSPQPGHTSPSEAVQPAAAELASLPAQDGTSPPLPDWHQHGAGLLATEPASASDPAGPAWLSPDEHLAASAAVAALEAQVPVVDAAALDAEAPPTALGQQLASRHQAAVAHQAGPLTVSALVSAHFQQPHASSGFHLRALDVSRHPPPHVADAVGCAQAEEMREAHADADAKPKTEEVAQRAADWVDKVLSPAINAQVPQVCM